MARKKTNPWMIAAVGVGVSALGYVVYRALSAPAATTTPATSTASTLTPGQEQALQNALNAQPSLTPAQQEQLRAALSVQFPHGAP
jgi:hypothetical protein